MDEAAEERRKPVKRGVPANEAESLPSRTVEAKAFSGRGILTETTFAGCAELSERLKEQLATLGYTFMTQIQALTIPWLLEGRDVLGEAKTGSGKTLAFVVPALDLLWRLKVEPRMGTVVLMMAPTRELVMQILDVVKDVGANVSHTFGAVMGGSNRKEEAKRLAKGVNLLVATPGRLADHLETTHDFVYKNLAMLVLDEADRMLEVGFEKQLTKILGLIPKDRQTALFSATQTSKVADLIRMSLRKPIHAQVKNETPTVAGLQQYFVVCAAENRLALLYKILKEKSKALVKVEANGETRQRHLKVMVFFSSCKSCQYHEDIFRLFSGFLKVAALHGEKKQAKRMESYNQFCLAEEGILFCTNVAARGLDFPNVDYIVQYDPPDDLKDYIHRAGRTARGEHGKGSSLLFLLPDELLYLKYLKEEHIKPVRVESEYKSIAKIQAQLELLVNQTPELKQQAKQAFQKFLLAYHSHSLKDVFDVYKLDLDAVSKAFALDTMPKVDLPTITGPKTKKRRTQ